MGLRLGWCWLVYKGPIVQCLWIDDTSLHLLSNQIQKHYCFAWSGFRLKILTSFWKITQLLAVNSSLLYSTTGLCFIAMFCDICCPSPHITFHYTLCSSIRAIAQKKYTMCINVLTIMLMVKIVQACLAVLVEIEIVRQIYEPNSEDIPICVI